MEKFKTFEESDKRLITLTMTKIMIRFFIPKVYVNFEELLNSKTSICMKTIVLSINIILSSVLFISCSSNDDEPTPPVEENQIIGEWSLVRADLGMAGHKNYESGDILWNYTPSGSLEITVREGVEPIDPFSTGFLGENLSYTITEMDGETTIRIISEEYPTLLNTMRVVLDENHLLLDGNLASDGAGYQFER
ncbi:MAG: hypothetical protein WDA08_10465 [Weeksellaceae bacterium]